MLAVKGVALPRETPAVDRGTGDAALPSEVAGGVHDGDFAGLPTVAAAGAHRGKTSGASAWLSTLSASTLAGSRSPPSDQKSFSLSSVSSLTDLPPPLVRAP